MKLSKARRWIGLYFLLSTSTVGAIILLFGGGDVIPLDAPDVTHSFQIIVPVLLGQLSVIFQWISRAEPESATDPECAIPGWAIRTPPIAGSIIIALAVIVLFISNRPETTWVRFSPERFQTTLTFVVALFNVTTILLVARLFPADRNHGTPNQ